nr:reverse transcriptase domain-containing protein [Tanacetum cinerariifolium]
KRKKGKRYKYSIIKVTEIRFAKRNPEEKGPLEGSFLAYLVPLKRKKGKRYKYSIIKVTEIRFAKRNPEEKSRCAGTIGGKLPRIPRTTQEETGVRMITETPMETWIIILRIEEKKQKSREQVESWMNVPITFPQFSLEDVSNEPIIVEVEIEGYLVRRIYVDEGASVEVMFKHCFENLSPTINSRLKETRTDPMGFAGEVMFNNPPSYSFNDTFNDEIPHSQRNNNFCHSAGHHIRVPEDGGRKIFGVHGHLRREGPVLIGPSGTEYTCALRLNLESINKEAEYEALLAGLRIAKMMKEVLDERSIDKKEINAIVKEEDGNWMTPIVKCLEEGIWSEDKNCDNSYFSG